VQELTEEGVRPTVPTQLASLASKQLIRLATGVEEELYRFGTSREGHDVRGRQTDPRQLHEQFVDWADHPRRHGRRGVRGDLGYHLEQAYRYRTELGPIDSAAREIADEAATRLARVGRRAFGRGDLHAAASLLQRAQALLQPKEVTRVEILADLADALLESGEFARATAVAEEAADIAHEIDAQGLALRARVTRDALTLYAAEDTSGGIRSIVANSHEAIAVFAALNDEASLARAWRLIALVSSTEGRFEEAAASLERVVEYAGRAGDTRVACRAAAGYASMLGLGATPAAEVSQRCTRLLDQVSGDRKAEAVILGVNAVADAMQGAFDRARALEERA
jgi:tetratricopeptide (TPR) repeat protein